MSEPRDYYEVLGVPKDSEPSAIKKSYRKLAKKNHPDLNKDDPGAEGRFKEIAEAYEVLADSEKRSRYDRYGHAGMQDTFGGGGFDWSNFSHMDDLSDMFGGGIFDALFGGGGRRRGPRRGPDLSGTIELTLEDAAKGLKRKIELNKRVACTKCSGSGGKSENCAQCGGQGQVRQVRRMGMAQFVNVGECPECHGRGRKIIDPCKDCSGDGVVRKLKKLEINIPSGIDDGMTMRVGGEGEAGPQGAPPGDLMINVRVKPHDTFERDGQDILVDMPLSFAQATLGDSIKVPTLEGKIEMDIPDGTPSGKTFRIRGKGLPHPNYSGTGDLYVRTHVIIPTKLDKKQKEAVAKTSKVLGDYHLRKRRKGWFQRMLDGF